MHERTFVEVLRERAAGPWADNGYTFLADGEREERRLSYAALDRRARAVASLLHARGVRDEPVLIVCPAGLDFVAALFGCFYAGAIAVPLPPPEPATPAPGLAQLRRVGRATGARLLLRAAATANVLQALQAPAGGEQPALEVLDVALADEAEAASSSVAEIGAEKVALLQYTSGSTAAPRGVVLTHANLLANAHAVRAAFAVTSASRGVSWLPPHHDMGLMGGILEPLLVGADTALLSPQAFLQRPLRWLQAIARLRATTCGGPNFAYDLLARRVPEPAKDGLDLSCWRVAFCGAEPVRAETLDAFSRAFARCGFRPAAFRPCYGLAEATLLVSAAGVGREAHRVEVDAAALEQGRVTAPAAGGGRTARFVSCGPPADRVGVSIVNPETGDPLPERRVGEVWVRSPGVAAGYWADAEAARDTFGARLPGGEGPYLRTGDLGFQLDGELYLTGRLKDLIVIRGRNLYPQDIEATLERAHACVRPGRAVAFSVSRGGEERLVVGCEINRRAKEPLADVADAVRRAVAAEHGVVPEAVVALQPGELPRTSSGKPRRPLCRELFLEGVLGDRQ